MESTTTISHFAPSDRSDDATLTTEADLVAKHDELCRVIDAMPQLVAVLNRNRQIIGANRILVDQLGDGEFESILGLRPGESVNCEHEAGNPGGCGTSEACSQCGAVLAILAAQEGHISVRECRINQVGGEALDLRIHATPLSLEGEDFVLFSATDIEAEKRREVLERTFFHDILNSAGGILGIAEVLRDSRDSEEQVELRSMLANLSAELLEEIRAQRELLAAERWELDPQSEAFESIAFLEELRYLYEKHPVGDGKKIEIFAGSTELYINNAKALAFRVVGNMIKNALEATSFGETVTVGCDREDDFASFWVHNAGAIPRKIQIQLFQRSFSTKGSGRGIGTYSMKMLTERYLGGDVDFRSDPETGTTFRARIKI